jgi:uncharacterized repeat protein (TIGR01451 family)
MFVVGGFVMPTPARAEASSLWGAAQEQLGSQASASAIMGLAKSLAVKFGVNVPEWGINSGKYNARQLSRTFFSSLFGHRASAAAATGLVGRWTFDDNTANDSSGLGNNGVLNNGASIVTDPERGQVLSLDGVNDYVEVLDSASLDLTNNFSISFWMKPANLTSFQDYIISKTNTSPFGSDNAYSVIWEYADSGIDNVVELYHAGGTGAGFRPGSAIQIPDTNWHYVNYVYDGATWKGFLDGQQIFSLPQISSLMVSSGNLYFGTFNTQGWFFNGLIDDIQIYNYNFVPPPPPTSDDITIATIDTNNNPVNGIVRLYEYATATHLIAPDSPSPQQTSAITFGRNYQVVGAYNGLEGVIVDRVINKDITYRVDALTRTVTEISTPGVNRIEFVFELMNMTLDTVDTSGNHLDGIVRFYGYNHPRNHLFTPGSPSPSSAIVSNGGTFQIAGSYNGLDGVITSIALYKDITYRVNALTRTVTEISTPGINKIEIVFELMNLTLDTVDLGGNHIDGTLRLYAYNHPANHVFPPGSPSPSSAIVSNGGTFQIGGFYGAMERVITSTDLYKNITYTVNADTGAVSESSTPGINKVNFVFNVVPPPPTNSADLSVTKETAGAHEGGETSGAAFRGQNQTYILSVSNNGPTTASSVSLTENLSEHTTFQSLNVTSGPAWSCTTPAVGSTGTITCTKPSLDQGVTTFFELVVNVSLTAPDDIVNTFSVSSETPDPFFGNNSVGLSNAVLSQPSIQGQKFNDLNGNGLKDDGEPGLPGWTITLRIYDLKAKTINYTTRTAITDENGNYIFNNLSSGSSFAYVWGENLQAGWVKTFPTTSGIFQGFGSYIAQLGDGESLTNMDFGNMETDTTPPQIFNQLISGGTRMQGQCSSPSLTNPNDVICDYGILPAADVRALGTATDEVGVNRIVATLTSPLGSSVIFDEQAVSSQIGVPGSFGVSQSFTLDITSLFRGSMPVGNYVLEEVAYDLSGNTTTYTKRWTVAPSCPALTGLNITPEESTIFASAPGNTVELTADILTALNAVEPFVTTVQDTNQPTRSIFSKEVLGGEGFTLRLTYSGIVEPTGTLFGTPPHLLFTDDAATMTAKLNSALTPDWAAKIKLEVELVDTDGDPETSPLFILRVFGKIGYSENDCGVIGLITWASSDDGIATVVSSGANTATSTGVSAGTIDAIATASSPRLQVLVFNDFGQRFSTSGSTTLGDGHEPYSDTAIVHVISRDADGDGVLDKDDDCEKIPGTKENKGCPVRLGISVEYVDGSSKPATHYDRALPVKVFTATDPCVTGVGFSPSNYSYIWNNCSAVKEGTETNSPNDGGLKPRRLRTDLAGVGLDVGSYFVLVQSLMHSGTQAHAGFVVPNVTFGQSRALGFELPTDKPLNYVQTAFFTINSTGTVNSERIARRVMGSELTVIQPEHVIWRNGEELYPFVFTAEGDWDVDVCLDVPQGYKIAEPGKCAQTFVANETKILEFKAVDIGSPRDFNVTANFKTKHKGKTTNFKGNILSHNKHAKGNR